MVSYPYKCDYCNGKDNRFVKLNRTKDYSAIEMSLNQQGMLRVRVGDDGAGNFVTQDSINVWFCPMCGRRFRRDK